MGKFTQLATVKEFVPNISPSGTDDNLINSLIDRASARIESYCDRLFSETTYTDEIHDGDGISGSLFVRQWPIISVTSLYDDVNRSWGSSSLIAAADYVFNKERGEIKLIKNTSLWSPSLAPKFGRGVGNIKIIYVAGYKLPGGQGNGTALPYDLEDACIKLVAMDYYDRGRERLGVASVSFGAGGSRSYVQGIPEEITVILDRYRRINV